MLLLVSHGVQERPGGLCLEGLVRFELRQDVVANVDHPSGVLTLLRLLDGVDDVKNLGNVLRRDVHVIQLDGQLLESSRLLELDADSFQSSLHIEVAIAGVTDGEASPSLTGPTKRVLANHANRVTQQAQTPTGQRVHEQDVRELRRTVILEFVPVTVVEIHKRGGTVENTGNSFDRQFRNFGNDVFQEEVEHLRRLGGNFKLVTDTTQADGNARVTVIILANKAILTRDSFPTLSDLTAHRHLLDLEIEDTASLFGGNGVMLLPILVEARVLENGNAVVTVFGHSSYLLYGLIYSKLFTSTSCIHRRSKPFSKPWQLHATRSR